MHFAVKPVKIVVKIIVEKTSKCVYWEKRVLKKIHNCLCCLPPLWKHLTELCVLYVFVVMS